jgi:RNA polymerase sigma-70 factor (ECF subfamily)
MTEGAVRVAVHRLRRRFGRCLRQTLADTVNDPADVDAELAYLLRVVSRSRHVELSTEV